MNQQALNDSVKVCFQTKHEDWLNAYQCSEALLAQLTEGFGWNATQTVLIHQDYFCIQTQAIDWRISFTGNVQRKLFCEDTWKIFSLKGEMWDNVSCVLMEYFSEKRKIPEGIYSYTKEIPLAALQSMTRR